MRITVLKNTMLVVIGTLILAFATGVFILPMTIVCGGISGIAIILDALIPLEIFTVDVVMFFLTWGLFLLGLFVLGRAFALKTLLSSLIYPPLLSLFLHLSDLSVLGGILNLQGYADLVLAQIVGAVFGGAFVGLGCALTFIGGGSTGGVDIIAFCFCKFCSRLAPATVIFFIDLLTIVLGMMIIGDVLLSALGILSAFVAALVIHAVFALKKIIT
jgi:uncharacterized membrane-anchored protein YitT (DUF2179 family)